jgi:hypothetical protein
MKPPREFVEQVQRFASSDVVEQLLDGMKARYEQDWGSTRPEDSARREHLYHMVQAVEGLKSELRSIAQSDLVDLYNRGALRRSPNWSII